MKWIKKSPTAVYLIIIAIAALITIFWELQSAAPKPKKQTADTYIPLGYVLVPIEIQNFNALNSVLGRHGIVDLFLPPSEPNKRPRSIGRRLRILRAPLNPRQFAVLVSENESARYVGHGPLFAVVQNPKNKSTIKRIEEKEKKRRIFIEKDS